MKSRDNQEAVRPAAELHMDEEHDEDQFGVVGNERLTALASAVLLVFILIELVSSVDLHVGIAVHIVGGVLLTGPLLVKLGSTGYRFLRYYTGSSAYVHKGPPRLPLRVLAPLLVVTTLLVVGSGLGLVVIDPMHASQLLPLHNLSVLVWLSLIAIHVGTYLWRTPRLIADDWVKQGSENQHRAHLFRLGLNLGALVAGVIAAVLLFPGAVPWAAWSQTSQNISGPLVIGLVIATLVLVVSRPWRWR